MSQLPDSDPDLPDKEVSLMGSSELSSDYSDFGNEQEDKRPNSINDATVTANENIPNWKGNFPNITTEPFTQNSGPSLLENFDASLATSLDYFNLLFKPEIFSDLGNHTNSYMIFKQDEIWRNRNNPDYVDSVWHETTVEALKTLFGTNILMGFNLLPQYKLYGWQNDFTGNSEVKKYNEM